MKYKYHSGETTKCWITRNLGASQQATAVDDATEPSAGWYWQFNSKQGYKHDGATRTPGTSWNNSISENSDWTAAKDPCTLELGSSWRMPTVSEWYNVTGSWTNWIGPWNSGLKMHAAGHLYYNNGSLNYRGSRGMYWTNSQISTGSAGYLDFSVGACYLDPTSKTYGHTLRCLMD